MALRIEDKKVIVEQVAKVASGALSVVAANYRGLTVQEMTELRQLGRKKAVHIQVVRNTLAQIAFKGTDFECMHSALNGPLVLAFSQTEPGAAAKLFRDFSKDHEMLEVKALAIGGKLLAASELDLVANLPTREEAIASLLRTMKASVTQLVRTMAEPHAQLVRVISAVSDKRKEAA